MSMRPVHEIYTEAMQGFGGTALWQPYPPNPNDRLEIGDIGFIHQDNGHFVRISRIRSDLFSHDDPHMYCGNALDDVLSDVSFDPPSPRDFFLRAQCNTTSQTAATLNIAGVGHLTSEYKCYSENAAGLYMRSPMHTVRSNRCKALGKYIGQHAGDTLEYAQQQGYDVEDEKKLLLITGLSRAQDYSMFACSGDVSEDFDFDVSTDSVGGLMPAWDAVAFKSTWQTDTTIHTSRGPELDEQTNDTYTESQVQSDRHIYQQSVFIWTCISQRRLFNSNTLEDAAELQSPAVRHDRHQLHDPGGELATFDGSYDEDEDDGAEYVQALTPKETVLDYIFEACPEAERATVYDEDVAWLLETYSETGSALVSIHAILDALKPEIIIDEIGAAQLKVDWNALHAGLASGYEYPTHHYLLEPAESALGRYETPSARSRSTLSDTSQVDRDHTRQVVSLSPAMPGKRGANLPEDNQDKDTAIRAAASTTDDAVPKRKRGVTP